VTPHALDRSDVDCKPLARSRSPRVLRAAGRRQDARRRPPIERPLVPLSKELPMRPAV